MDLQIKKDKRNKGRSFHKIPQLGACKAKLIAFKDITNEAHKAHDRNYVDIESRVLNSLKFDFIYLYIP